MWCWWIISSPLGSYIDPSAVIRLVYPKKAIFLREAAISVIKHWQVNSVKDSIMTPCNKRHFFLIKVIPIYIALNTTILSSYSLFQPCLISPSSKFCKSNFSVMSFPHPSHLTCSTDVWKAISIYSQLYPFTYLVSSHFLCDSNF